jgi:hypothetical protein
MAGIKATIPGGKLIELDQCYVDIPAYGKVIMRVLPEIGDSKSASYNDEPIMGRAFPLKTYSHSENRSVSMTIHFITITKSDIDENKRALRALESAVYPRDQGGGPFIPPPICKIKCGKTLADDELCVVLRSYSVKFSTDSVWDEEQYIPYNFDVETTWEVVYRSSNLPGQDRILSTGG